MAVEESFDLLSLEPQNWIKAKISKRKSDNCKETEPTDAYGEVEFQGFGGKIGKYVRVDDRTDMNVIIDLLTKNWGLKLPKLLISVTGGAKHFQIKPRLKEVFRRGLVKLAKSTGAWVTTSGTNTGVMKHVGEAIRDYGFTPRWKDKIIAIGIAPWGCIQNREDLINNEGLWPASYGISGEDSQTEGTFLDPNHSHFILVDNGTNNEYGIEIKFRADLTCEVAKKVIPGTDVLIPAVVVMVEGGPSSLETVHDSLKNETPVTIVKGSGRAADILAYGYERAKKEGINFQLKKELRDKIEKEFEDDKDNLMKLVCESLEKRHLITLFVMDSENSACDIDVAVLKAILKTKKRTTLDNLRLTMEWNRIDVAKTDIFTDDSKWRTGMLDELMILALKRNQVDFVKIFLDNGVNLKTILTKENLQALYEPIEEQKERKVASENIHKIMKRKSLEELESSCEVPAQELFLWSLLKNEKEMSFLFWKLLKEPLPAALVANKLLKEVAKSTDDLDERNKLQEHAVLFEERAIGVLNVCYDTNEDKTCQLLDQQRDNWGKTSCILMAIDAKNKNFISHSASQSLLNNVWMGQLHNKTKQWMLPFFYFIPLFFWLITFKKKNVTNNPTADPSGQTKVDLKWWEKIQAFYTAPVNIFIVHVLSYCVTLIIFSYVLMVELDEHISEYEIFLYVWIFSFSIEEFRQILDKESNSIWGKFKDYCKNLWNVIDAFNIVLFVIGISIRHTLTYELEIARIILAINLCTFFVRCLHIFSVHKKLGPKLVMLWDMVFKDLIGFMMILFVFLTAYGVASQAILYPNSQESSFKLIKAVFKKPYFQMYGELFLEEIAGDECYGNKTCPSETAKTVEPVLMAVYILLTNVLLLNLLIAMFSNTFQNIQDNAGLHWRFQRFNLISEYCSRPALPPPFILINHLFLILKKTKAFCKTTKRTEKHKAFRKKRKNSEDLLHWEDEMGDHYKMNEEKSNSSCTNEKVSQQSYRTEKMMKKIEQNEKRMEQTLYEMEKQIKEIKQMLLTLKSSNKETEYLTYQKYDCDTHL